MTSEDVHTCVYYFYLAFKEHQKYSEIDDPFFGIPVNYILYDFY